VREHPQLHPVAGELGPPLPGGFGEALLVLDVRERVRLLAELERGPDAVVGEDEVPADGADGSLPRGRRRRPPEASPSASCG
jgi:hypothetical protein